ncbi:hypothetical protein E8K88_16445 [Lampropedia aestuarii]|uniref:Secreted protein n=1 Tax=Lampropedia aestuarii TaxID=2562762 RepID=A0A4S5BJF6_9BURK|nr:hypothetical protein [Lampropedia aestuarii]THJ30955.1 hypothetical protein E8K88_16445 [Lampropedia aestuarii]
MFRSRLTACVAAAMAACSAIAVPLVSAYRWVMFRVMDACAIAAPRNEVRQTKPSWVIKARAFAASLMRRERPVFTDSWRMCPSV